MRMDFKKNSNAPTPPANGGFSVMRACSVLLVLFIASALLIMTPAARHGALAQEAPGNSSGDRDSLVQEVVTLDSEISSLSGRLADLEAKSVALEARIGGLNDEVAAKRGKVASKRRALSDRARNMYVNGRSNTLVMLLSSEDVSDFFKRNEYVQKVNERDTILVDAIKREAEELDASLAELKRRKKETDGVASELETRRGKLVASRSERAEVLARAGTRSGDVQDQSQRVESKMQEINPPVPTGKHTGRFLMMVATGYSPEEPGLSDATASGLKARHGVVAVDPRVIPLGTRVHVEGYGYAIAGDTGSAIKGMRIDLCFDRLEECNAYGKRTVRVEILD